MVRHLSVREREVLRLIVAGRSTKQLAFDLGITFKTAVSHRTRLMSKLGAHNTAELIRNGIREGFVDTFEIRNGDGAAGNQAGNEFWSKIESAMKKHREARQNLEASLACARSLCGELNTVRRDFQAVQEETRFLCNELKGSVRHSSSQPALRIPVQSVASEEKSTITIN